MVKKNDKIKTDKAKKTGEKTFEPFLVSSVSLSLCALTRKDSSDYVQFKPDSSE